ncbi:MAG: class I SAM-dependent rRNA methyltransferase [Deltaproteobacteria bacterium]|nr:class I SAM-dependent rRNA methyltransferase [Deltaproteobacteria bacterium]
MTQSDQIPPYVTVKAGHVQPIWAGHPWVFKQAIERVEPGLGPGDEVLVLDPHGKVLGRGLYSPKSAIVVRLYTTDGTRAIDASLMHQQIERAVAMRRAQGLPESQPDKETTGFRLIHGEGDGLPGLVVDAFDDVLVVQLGTAGLARLEDAIVEGLVRTVAPRAIIDRTPAEIAKVEGVPTQAEGPRVLMGETPTELSFRERGLRFELPLELAQKTGYYFDQRPLRDRIEALSRGSRVLDACCYVGSIGLSAARGGASEVLCVDKSEPAIEVGKRCAELNGATDKVTFQATEARHAFRAAAEEGTYDIVICDPPKLAVRRRSRNKALNTYRKLAAGACSATSHGGVLAFCSCSASISTDALQRSLALGARDAGRRAVVFDRCVQGGDHPVVAAFPEGLYLRVLLARIEPV